MADISTKAPEGDAAKIAAEQDAGTRLMISAARRRRPTVDFFPDGGIRRVGVGKAIFTNRTGRRTAASYSLAYYKRNQAGPMQARRCVGRKMKAVPALLFTQRLCWEREARSDERGFHEATDKRRESA